jgi:alkyldihydroxyacetonephosphate synthase
MYRFDDVSRLATFGAGVSGPELGGHLRARGHTLGHFPQSFEYSTLGGWVATRSSGQQSLGYGRIEDLFVGGRLVAPAGSVELLPFPASAAGPDLRALVLRSEGHLGLIMEATVRASPLPEREDSHGVFFPDFATGRTAVREMVRRGLPLSMLRLSSPTETRVMLALVGHTRAIGALETVLSLRKLGDPKTMLMMGLTGSRTDVRRMRRAALGICRSHGGVHIGRPLGRRWRASRFSTPYLRNTLWEMGYAVDTFETATDWSHITEMTDAIEEGTLLGSLADFGTRVLVMSHISHVYQTGTSIYTTCVFPLAADPDETLDRWRWLKRTASETVIRGRHPGSRYPPGLSGGRRLPLV